MATYTYDPGKVNTYGLDRMRFELGDTMVDGGADTTALTNEEIEASISMYPKSWKRSKLMLLESICRRFAYEVNTKTGPLTLNLGDRAEIWRRDYEQLKKEISSMSAVTMIAGNKNPKPPYFYTGMHSNERADC